MSSAAANPFRPGFSEPPPLMAGRAEVIAVAEAAIETAAVQGRTPMPLLLVGSRGVGKTVLLDELADRAAQRYGWPRVGLEIGRPGDVASQLVSRVSETIALLRQTDANDRMRLSDATVKAGGLGVSAEWRFARPDDTASSVDPHEAIRRALADLGEVAQERGAGVVLTIDEMHQSDAGHLDGLGAALQESVRHGRPLVVAGAGLPAMRDLSRLPTYFERGRWSEIGLLDERATREALLEPARLAGRPFDDGAGERLVRRTGGYPFAIQVFGDEAWRASEGARTITREHVEAALERGERTLDQGLYALRWRQASPQERDYLAAVADIRRETGRPATGGEAAARLGMTAQRASPIRARLIDKGLLIADGRNLRFVVPGLGAFIAREHQRNPDRGPTLGFDR